MLNIGVFNKSGQSELYEYGSWTATPSISRKFSKSIAIPIDTLDKILQDINVQKIGILKIDVEGAEIEVLEGSKHILKKCRKVIVEIHDNSLLEAKKILETQNFNIEILKNGEWVIGTKIN